MAHVESKEREINGKFYLFSKNNELIGGPYASREEANNKSRLVSQMVGESPIEDYRAFLSSPVQSMRFQGRSNYPSGGVLSTPIPAPTEPLRPSGSLMDLKPQLEIGEEIPVDQLYQAILNSEHRNDVDRLNPWIQNKQGSSAWGPVQILKSLMGDAPKMVNLTPEEEDYVSRYQNDQQTVSPEDKILYTSIAKKLIQNYWDKYKDPLRVANAWRWGPRGSAPSTQYFGEDDDGNRRYGLEKDISKPGSVGSDPDYWKEFRKVMGL